MHSAVTDRWRRFPLRARCCAGAALAVLLLAAVAPGVPRAGLAGALEALTSCGLMAAAALAVVDARLVDDAEHARLREVAVRRADQVSVLSHEVRTPLAVIKGSAELLAEGLPGPLTDRQRTFLARIVTNADHVVSLAEDLLTQARIEAGLFDVHLERVDLRAVLRSSVADLRQALQVRIALDAPGPPLRVFADAQLVKQAVTNLVVNAVRHAPDARNVTVRVTRSEDDVVVAISDDGRGMTREERARLFERFSSGTRTGDGTGIGLYITQNIVELHGGRIYVDSLPDRGTTMTFTLPDRGPSRER